MKRFATALVAAALWSAPADGQGGAATLVPLIEGLGTSARVLVIAAHPDDEDTALITWLARGRHVETAYLSLTRGDGGQNLIGNELGEALGAIRTEELLAARRIDGGQQYFTRAYDFGFSKNAEETLTQWARDSILRDVVTVVRAFRPHVIVAVFSGTPADGHGHHQVSGILARDAYDVASDTTRFPRVSTSGYGPWTVVKFYRGAFFRNQDRATIRINVGEYDPILGASYAEIASASRSEHKSQAFGSLRLKGVRFDQLVREATRATAPEDAKREQSIFDGIDTTWNRFAPLMRTRAARSALDSLPAAFAAARAAVDLFDPPRVAPALVRITRLLDAICPPGDAPTPCFDNGAIASTLAAPNAPPDLYASEHVLHAHAINPDLASSWIVARERTNRALVAALGIAVEATAGREVVGLSEPVAITVRTYNRGREPLGVRAVIARSATSSAAADLRAAPPATGRSPSGHGGASRNASSPDLRSLITPTSGVPTFGSAASRSMTSTVGDTRGASPDVTSRREPQVPPEARDVTPPADEVDESLPPAASMNRGQLRAPLATLAPDSARTDSATITLGTIGQPWWRTTPRQGAMFTTRVDPIAETSRRTPATVSVILDYQGTPVKVEAPVVFRFADPIDGEINRPIAAAPAITLTLDNDITYARADVPMERAIRVHVRSHASDARTAQIRLTLPNGLVADSAERRVAFDANARVSGASGAGAAFGVSAGAPTEIVRTVTFNVRGRLTAGRHVVRATATSGSETFNAGYTTIAYPHIRTLRLFRPASLGIEAVDVKLPPRATIAYIVGVGDNVAPMLEQLGLDVTIVDPASLPRTDLSRFTSVVVGSRAYESNPALVANNARLLEYARDGGTLVVQYGQYEMAQPGMMPFPITLARPADRVTVEGSPVAIIDSSAQVLNAPNQITTADFAGWVQDRSIYMPRTFDSAYQSSIEIHDPNEAPNRGALLVARYGKGTYVYTSLAFFRQLPNGVPGAARLFINLLSARAMGVQP